MLTLVGTDGEHYYTFELEPGKYEIGRRPECDITIPNKTVSRKHAEIEIDSNGENGYLNDLGSHNGTTVNNMKVSTRTPIKPGDQIELRDGSRSKTFFKELPDIAAERNIPDWIKRDAKKLSGEITRMPERAEIDANLNEQLIVEYYSR